MAGETTTDPLISTKLRRLTVDRSCVPRPHLIARFDQYRDRPLTLVSAPTRYGKSILISSWLEVCEDPGPGYMVDGGQSRLRCVFRDDFYKSSIADQRIYPGNYLFGKFNCWTGKC